MNFFNIGDLVLFTGYEYSPFPQEMGIVVGKTSGKYHHVIYKVYWFKEHTISDSVANHLELISNIYL